jgi:hypothetical protein
MTRISAFLQALQQLGWTDGRNVTIDYRWGAGDPERIRKFATELVALAPYVILAAGAITVVPLQQVNRTVPIVFANISDPVGAGIVAQPCRQLRGFFAPNRRAGAHHLSRKLTSLGHESRLMPAKYVRPYSRGQKHDFRDAEASPRRGLALLAR